MIIPVILEKNINEIKNKLKKVEQYSPLVQIDILDGTMFGNSTYNDIENIEKIKTSTKLELHFLVQNPLDYLDNKLENVIRVVSQIEADGISSFIKRAKDLNYKVGLSIAPKTPNELVEPFLKEIDVVQFMTIKPGIQSHINPFLPEVLDKIADFRNKHPNIIIQTDGHNNSETIPWQTHIGVDNFVVGSDIFDKNEKDIPEHIKYLESLLN